MSDKTLTGKTWVAFGDAGAVGSVHSVEGGFTYKLLNDTEYGGVLPTLEVAKNALVSKLPPGSGRPEFREH
jgi:hypothetical protein